MAFGQEDLELRSTKHNTIYYPTHKLQRNLTFIALFWTGPDLLVS
jgi:hypothetical protein